MVTGIKTRNLVLTIFVLLSFLKGMGQGDFAGHYIIPGFTNFLFDDAEKVQQRKLGAKSYGGESLAEKGSHVFMSGKRKFDERFNDTSQFRKTNKVSPKWYVGVGAGYTFFFHRFKEPKPIPPGGKTGRLNSLHFELMYVINERWIFESGVSLKAIVPPEYIARIGGKPEAGMTIIPFRLNYVINLSPGEVDLMIFAGYSQGFKSDQFTFGFLSPDLDANGDYYGNVLFPLADIGARCKLVLGRIHLGFFASYSQGFKDIYRIQVDGMANVTGGFPKLITSKGSNLNFGMNAYYAVFGKKQRS